MPLQVIGAGFGRTGTLSLKVALQQLGFNKCHHMVEVMRNPKSAAAWVAASDGKEVDWHEIFADYKACVDWPSCMFYRELMEAFPEAKVVLTVRDSERWYESISTTIAVLTTTTPRWLCWLVPAIGAVIKVSYACVWKTFDNRNGDKEYVLEVFRAHIEEVKRVVPPSRLLVFEVAQGWGPLCEFLDVPVPTGAFPHLNDRDVMAKRLRILRILRVLGPLVFFALLVGLWLLITWLLPAGGPAALLA